MAALVPVAALVGNMVSLSLGTSFVKHLFGAMGAEGTRTLRVDLSALILVLLCRPWRLGLTHCAYAAFLRRARRHGPALLPLALDDSSSLAIAVELSGPLALALDTS